MIQNIKLFIIFFTYLSTVQGQFGGGVDPIIQMQPDVQKLEYEIELQRLTSDLNRIRERGKIEILIKEYEDCIAKNRIDPIPAQEEMDAAKKDSSLSAFGSQVSDMYEFMPEFGPGKPIKGHGVVRNEELDTI